MIITKLLLAFALGLVYSLLSVTTLFTGASAIMRRGIRGGMVAGSGTALGLAIYAAVAITGLGLVQYFLRPVHLAIIETLLGMLFIATGIYLLEQRKIAPRKAKEKPADGKQWSLWTYFVTNLLLILSSPQKIAYIAGMFLFFKLHVTDWGTKAAVPVAVLFGSWTAWLLYSIAVARGGKRLAHTALVQHNLDRLSRIGHLRFFVAFRRTWIKRHAARRLLQLGKMLLIVVGVVLVAKGIWLFASWGFDPWSPGAVRG